MKGWVRALVIVVGLAVLLGGFWVWLLLKNPIQFQANATRNTMKGADFRERTFGPDGRFTYLTHGAGPPILLIHAEGQQAGAWAALARVLASDYTVYAIDLPGHGRSGPATGDLSPDVLAEAILAMLGQVEGQAIIVGESAGAWAAMLAAEQRPDAVSRLVLVNGGGLPFELRGGLALIPENLEQTAAVLAAMHDPSVRPRRRSFLEAWLEAVQSGPYGRVFGNPDALRAASMEGRLDEFTVPVDVVWGEADRWLVADYPHRLVAALPRARLTWLARCGHRPASECPQALGETLRRILNEAPTPAPIPPVAPESGDTDASDVPEQQAPSDNPPPEPSPREDAPNDG